MQQVSTQIHFKAVPLCLLTAEVNLLKALFQARCIEILYDFEGDFIISPRVGKNGVRVRISAYELGDGVIVDVN